MTGKEREREREDRKGDLHRLVFRAIYREKPEKGLRVRDWKESSDAKVEAEVDRRDSGRDRAENEKAWRELLKWAAALVARVQVHEKETAGVRRAEVGRWRGMRVDGGAI